LFKLTFLSKYKLCRGCGYVKHILFFRYARPGCKKGAFFNDECSLCNRIRRWHSKLNKEQIEALEVSLVSDEDPDYEIGVCCHCSKEREGERRAVFDGAFICNICYWKCCHGRIEIEIE
jgi:hypothetical protein